MAAQSKLWCKCIDLCVASAFVAGLSAVGQSATAADWSDTALSWRYGTDFAEPFDNNADGSRKDIAKNIFALTHADGYAYGTNFFNVDILLSNGADPGNGVAGQPGAQEIYVVYRNTLDAGKIFGQNFQMGPIRDWGATIGFDMNSKNDAYASKKRMLVLGPTVMIDVPGFWNISILVLDESNAPNGIPSRYYYNIHPALDTSWGIPIGDQWVFKGYFQYIAAKGTNEFGGPTAPETHFDGEIMYDLGSLLHGPKKTFFAGFEYEYWKNKFGNPATEPGAGPGALAKTPMVRLEYHF
ncbi:MAG: outer envelope protein [Burkholderiaceae bacterium]|jgi:hypothetical protein